MTDEFDEEGEDGENGPQGTANGEPISGRDEGSRGADGRFLRGHSGNLKGRKPKSRNVKTILADRLNKPRRFRGEHGQVTTMSAAEAFIEKAITDALKGTLRGGERLTALMKAAGYFDQPAEPEKKAELTLEDQAILARFQKAIKDEDEG